MALKEGATFLALTALIGRLLPLIWATTPKSNEIGHILGTNCTDLEAFSIDLGAGSAGGAAEPPCCSQVLQVADFRNSNSISGRFHNPELDFGVLYHGLRLDFGARELDFRVWH
eukprot:1046667-Rhodomonas_salina.1